MISIVERVFTYAQRFPDKTALTDGKKFVSYSQLCKQILKASSIFSEKYNLQKGDFVILAANKDLSFVSAYFACHLLGIITLPLAPDVNHKRLMLIAEKTNPALSVGISSDALKCKKCEFVDICNADDNYDDYEIDEVLFPDENNIADVIFTTGTTGEPKGVTLSQRNIESAVININSFISNKDSDVEMIALPLSHSFGLGRLRCALANGQTLVILGTFANVKRFYRYIEEFNVNGFGMVPASWSLIKKMSGLKLSEYADRLNYIEIGSAPMPIEEKKTLIEMLPNTRICMHYGLTEASRSAFMEFHEDVEYLDTVGKQSPNTIIKIMDEKGNCVPDGNEGEICVMGGTVTNGYYKMDDVNNVSYWGDFFRTGDWGIRISGGYIKLCSRKKELINVGGKKVSPIEVEEQLLTIPYIEDCACVAIPDPEMILGEVVKAYIVTKKPEMFDLESVNQYLLRNLENYKVPVEYEMINEIPKTSSGKIQRLLLKK